MCKYLLPYKSKAFSLAVLFPITAICNADGAVTRSLGVAETDLSRYKTPLRGDKKRLMSANTKTGTLLIGNHIYALLCIDHRMLLQQKEAKYHHRNLETMVWTFGLFQIHCTKYSNLDNGFVSCINHHWSVCLPQTCRLMCKARRTPDISSPAMITTRARLQNRGGTTMLIQSKANSGFCFTRTSKTSSSQWGSETAWSRLYYVILGYSPVIHVLPNSQLSVLDSFTERAQNCWRVFSGEKKDCPSHYLHYCFWPLNTFLSVSVSVVLYLARLFHPPPLFILRSPYCHQVRNVPVIDAHQCTASDRSRQHEKRSCWNKYICNEGKGAAKWLANLCLSKAERGPHWHIDP